VIKAIPQGWRDNQTGGSLGDRDDRVYLDFRGVEYPDIARDTRSYIDYGDCETTTAPRVRGTTPAAAGHGTFLRTSEAWHTGSYGYKVLRTTDGGAEVMIAYLTPNAVDNMCGFIAGETVEFAAWFYVPAGGIELAECSALVQAYYGAAWNDVISVSMSGKSKQVWKRLSGRAAISASAASMRILFRQASTSADNEFYYVDDIECYRSPTFTKVKPYGDDVVAYWPLNAANGLVYPDASGNSADATAGAAQTAMDGPRGKAAYFDGVANRMLATVAASSLTAGFTLAAWVYYETGGASARILDKSSGANGADGFMWILRADAGANQGRLRFNVNAGTERTTDAGFVTAETWTHVAVTVTDAAVLFYRAGVLVTSAAGSGALSGITTAEPMAIGNRSTATDRPFKGGIAHAAVYNRVLTVDEIASVYRGTMALTHSVPGTHMLTGGYTQHLVTMPSTFTLRVKFRPKFAYDTASDQDLMGWNVSGTIRFRIRYLAADDHFRIVWRDAGTARTLNSAQYDDGTTHRNIDQWIEMIAAIDLTTGTTAGGALWMNGTQDRVAWSGNIDAKASTFNRLQIRAHDAVQGAYDIAYVELIPNYVVTNAEVQAAFKGVTAERIYFPLDGHATGRTRCDVTRFIGGVGLEKNLADGDTGRVGAARAVLDIINSNGEFSDDQYAAFSATLAQYNGTAAQKYLRRNNRLTIESHYGGDFDYEYVGEVVEGYRRDSIQDTASRVSAGGIDHIARLARTRFPVTRIYEGMFLSSTTECDSLVHMLLKEGRPRLVQYLANNSFEQATIADYWVASGGTLSRQTGGLLGTYKGRIVPGAAERNVSQTVTFLGTQKLNIGDTFTFSVWLLSAAAATGANNYIGLYEYDAGGSNGGTTTLYTLAGGEGWVRYDVSRTITDADSNRLVVQIWGAAGDTIDFDAAMLIPGSEPYYVHQVSSVALDAACASGVTPADKADVWDWRIFGTDVDIVPYNHPWRRYNEGMSVWGELNALIAGGLEPVVAGFDASGTFTLRSVLKASWTVPHCEGLLTGNDVMRGMRVDKAQRFNRFVGTGVSIYIEDRANGYRLMWDAKSADVFDMSGGMLDEKVIAGASWPHQITFLAREPITGEFWAQYGSMSKQKYPATAVENPGAQDAELTWWQKFWRWLLWYDVWGDKMKGKMGGNR